MQQSHGLFAIAKFVALFIRDALRNKQAMGCDAQLSDGYISKVIYKHTKLGQTDLDFWFLIRVR